MPGVRSNSYSVHGVIYVYYRELAILKLLKVMIIMAVALKLRRVMNVES